MTSFAAELSDSTFSDSREEFPSNGEDEQRLDWDNWKQNWTAPQKASYLYKLLSYIKVIVYIQQQQQKYLETSVFCDFSPWKDED